MPMYNPFPYPMVYAYNTDLAPGVPPPPTFDDAPPPPPFDEEHPPPSVNEAPPPPPPPPFDDAPAPPPIEEVPLRLTRCVLPYPHAVMRGAILWLPSRTVCYERAALFREKHGLPELDRWSVALEIDNLEGHEPRSPRTKVFVHPVVVLALLPGPDNRIAVATITKKYKDSDCYLPVVPEPVKLGTLMIEEPPGMRKAGGSLYVGEIYSVPWYCIEIKGQPIIQLDPTSIENVRMHLRALYGLQIWTL